jgi:multidrug resistance efflux pump
MFSPLRLREWCDRILGSRDRALRVSLREWCGQAVASRSRVLRVSLGIALLVTSAGIYGPAILYTTAAEAVVNARVVAMKAPIEGEVVTGPPGEGSVVRRGEVLFDVSNQTVDRARLDTLLAERAGLDTKLANNAELTASLTAQQERSRRQSESYRQATVARLELMLKESRASVATARANAEDARLDHQRKSQLGAKGFASTAAVEQATQNLARTKAEVERTTAVADRVAEELKAAHGGIYVYQDRNNITYSEQHAEELALRLSEVAATRGELEARRAEIDREIAAETARIDRLTLATVAAPFDGVVWRPTVVTGGHVARDSAPLDLIDCSALYVTASLSSRKFDSIHRGDEAMVQIPASGDEHKGWVVDIRAVEGAAQSERFAAPMPALSGRRILVLIRLDEDSHLARDSKYCGVGLKADVRFTGGTPVIPSAQAAPGGNALARP